jgi:starch synthase (maltosyl-transferring)
MEYEPRIGRIPIRDLSPLQPEDLWPAKAYAGEVVPFSATIFKDGHDILGADLALTSPSGVASLHRLIDLGEGSDRWQTHAHLVSEGHWRWHIEAWVDEWATYIHNAGLKIPAGVDVPLMLLIGVTLLKRAAKADPANAVLADAAKQMAAKRLSAEDRFAVALSAEVTAELTKNPLRALLTRSDEHELRVERALAGRGSWYEFFPRSEGAKQKSDGTWKSGTFRTAAKRLPAVREMGFDVLYIPPIHPIGRTFRKGPNNTLIAGPGDPGSPWAIGSAEGGHDAIHPDLGTVADFSFFVKSVKREGLELAIDLALQCSPDHPWVTEHPEWFTTLPDKTIAFAENPPKKYQDIFPLNFDNDFEGLSREVLRIVKYWIGLGVKIFRVDNPHTKPLRFWEWLLHEVNAEFPEVIFFAEAFTAPAMLYGLGQIGFQQSYTYYTWRNTKEELEEFLVSISDETAAYLRPNLFVNTPDILTAFLQFGGAAAFKVRAAIAATASPSWGMYAGYELFENVARPGAEEYIDNEKFQYKARDFAAAEEAGRSLAPYITRLNEIRNEHPALGQLRNLDVHWSDDGAILVYSKYLSPEFAPGGDAIIVVANVDPHSVRETFVHLDIRRFGIPAGELYEVTDLITGQVFTWGLDNFVRLDAFTEPVHILSVTLPKGS